jgi:7-cyano-7-deazaguanine synthase
MMLLSGGMDSVTALYDALERHEVLGALSFDYGAKHNAREIPMAQRHCTQHNIPHQVINLSFINNYFTSALLLSGGDIPTGHYREASMKKTVVPFRNGIMLSIAAGYAESKGANALIIAAHTGDHTIYPDCRESFMKPMADAIQAGTYAGIEVLRPFIHMSKADIVKRGQTLNIDYTQTWSCYAGGDIHCGVCGTCIERREAFIRAGCVDPTPYAHTGPLPAGPE